MPLIVAIEPDRRQASQISAMARGVLHAEIVLAESSERAIAVLGTRLPDLILTATLLPPADEATLAEYLRRLDTTGHRIQTLTIPVLAPPGGGAWSDGSGVLSRLRRPAKTSRSVPDGCDPAVFAQQILEYLERAEAERLAAGADDSGRTNDHTRTAGESVVAKPAMQEQSRAAEETGLLPAATAVEPSRAGAADTLGSGSITKKQADDEWTVPQLAAVAAAPEPASEQPTEPGSGTSALLAPSDVAEQLAAAPTQDSGLVLAGFDFTRLFAAAAEDQQRQQQGESEAARRQDDEVQSESEPSQPAVDAAASDVFAPIEPPMLEAFPTEHSSQSDAPALEVPAATTEPEIVASEENTISGDIAPADPVEPDLAARCEVPECEETLATATTSECPADDSPVDAAAAHTDADAAEFAEEWSAVLDTLKREVERLEQSDIPGLPDLPLQLAKRDPGAPATRTSDEGVRQPTTRAKHAGTAPAGDSSSPAGDGLFDVYQFEFAALLAKLDEIAISQTGDAPPA